MICKGGLRLIKSTIVPLPVRTAECAWKIAETEHTHRRTNEKYTYFTKGFQHRALTAGEQECWQHDQ